jgi:hypothetical protein
MRHPGLPDSLLSRLRFWSSALAAVESALMCSAAAHCWIAALFLASVCCRAPQASDPVTRCSHEFLHIPPAFFLF